MLRSEYILATSWSLSFLDPNYVNSLTHQRLLPFSLKVSLYRQYAFRRCPAVNGHSGHSQMPSAVEGVNGIGQTFEYPERTPDGPYRVLDQYHSKPRRLRVACVGAGASGLCLAYKMGKMLEPGSWELTLFDKNNHFGGTWLENTYPGVACDIPVSH